MTIRDTDQGSPPQAASASTLWMPLYIGDYLRDTRRLSLAEHGAYILLLMEIWTHGQIANDDNRIARILGVGVAEWKAIRPEIEGFFAVSPASWRHGRVEKERARVGEISQKRSSAGKAGAKARWQGDGNGNSKSMLTTATTTVTDKTTDDLFPPNGGVGSGEPDPDADDGKVSSEDIQKFLDHWNDLAPRFKWPRVDKFTDTRRDKARLRIKSLGLQYCLDALTRAAEEAKMLNNGKPPQWFTFDFVVRNSENLVKIMEKKYDRDFNSKGSGWDFNR